MNRSIPTLTASLAMLGLIVYASVLPARSAAEDKAADDGYTSLIPTEGLTGWNAKDQDTFWKLQDGVIFGDNIDQKGSILWTDNQYGDFELIVEYKTPSEDYDSGVYLHGTSHQVQIGVSRQYKIDLTGCIYCPKDSEEKYPLRPADTVKANHKLGEWNTLHIITKGKSIKTYLNGELINDYTAVNYPDMGKIGLQLHPKVDMKMYFKTVKIRPLVENQ